MPDDLKPCMFCSAVLSKDGENASTSFCGNLNCPFSAIEISDEWWNSAHCWKLLDESPETIKKLQMEIEERKSGFTQTNAGLLKFIDEQAEIIRVLRESNEVLLEALTDYGDHRPGCLKSSRSPVYCLCGFREAIAFGKEALLATAEER